MARFSVLFFLELMGCICDSYDGFLRWFLGVLDEGGKNRNYELLMPWRGWRGKEL